MEDVHAVLLLSLLLATLNLVHPTREVERDLRPTDLEVMFGVKDNKDLDQPKD